MDKNTTTFTIVIPTCERAHYLEHSLRTCLCQNDSGYEILVSDNASNDETKNVVEGLHDSRINYVNTNERISMAKNWEFALRHVTSDYVIYLGDDDGLMPYTVRTLRELISRSGTKAVRWRKNAYNWPDFPMIERQNVMKIRFGKKVIKRHAHESLHRLGMGYYRYSSLPGIYHSCVKTSVLRRLGDFTDGLIFAHSHPDVWTCILIAGIIDTYLDVSLPLSIPGSSKKSNGATILYSKNGRKAFDRFNQESLLSDRSILQAKVTSSIDLLVLDMLYLAKPILKKMGFDLKISDLNYLLSALKRARSGSMAIWGDYEKEIQERLDIKRSFLLKLQYEFHKRSVNNQIEKIEPLGLQGDVLTIDATSFGINNVYDASQFCSTLQRNDRDQMLKNLCL